MTQVKSGKTFMMRLAAMLLAVVVLSLTGIELPADAASNGFYVSGTKIMDANGNQFVMRGVNIAHAWYKDETDTSIAAAASLGANTVRVVVADGERWTKTTKDELEHIVSVCKSNSVVCILEVHDATGSDSTSYLDNAVNYWIENKSVLQGNEKYVILNIANEWYGSWNGYSWAEGNKSAIKKIRNAGITNMIMIDCAGWGQYPDSIKDYGKSVFEADSQKNTVFSIHMYEYAGGNASTVKTNIDNALNIGVPVVIGEFGGQHTNGDVDEATIMSYCTQKNVGYLGWSWKGNSSDLYYLDIANDWNGTSLTTWGDALFNGTCGIKNTAKTCTVFTGETGGDDDDDSSYIDSSEEDSTYDESSETEDNGVDPYISLFWGENTAGSWCQAASVMTAKNGGSFDSSNITDNGYFYVEYTNSDQEQIELILQSWSGGEGWAKVNACEYGTANDHFFAKYSYSDCVSAFGSSNFAGLLDQIHVGSKNGSTTLYSVCWCTGSAGSSADTSSEYIADSSEEENSSEIIPDSSEEESSSDDETSSSESKDSYVSVFWGESSASSWGQAVSVLTSKNGGSFDASAITSGGYFYVEYSGTQDQLELILQSWSGGEGWAKVSMTESGTANGHYFAKYSYDSCKNAFGSDFSGKLDQLHVGAASSSLTVYSVCYCYPA